MWTNIGIDDALINEAMQATGLKTERDTVELGLKTLLRGRLPIPVEECFPATLLDHRDLDPLLRENTDSNPRALG